VSTTIDATKLLRPGLLEGVSVLIAGPGDSRAGSVRSACEELGASVSVWAPVAPHPAEPDSDVPQPEAPKSGAPESEAPKSGAPESDAPQPDGPPADVDLLFVDGAGLFAHAGAQGGADERAASRAALRACLDGAWEATRTVANAAFLDGGRPGRIVYLAPAPDAGRSLIGGSQLARHADAACAGLENLARTLSIEWARYGITPVTIAPGAQSTDGEVAALTAYLASPAGAYFSGCLLDLRGATEG
jgi:NAD(P)-dependent dehydrogenase (short-subunit alcohol dehydrogenase family)